MKIQVSIDGAGTWTEELWEGMETVSASAILAWANWNWDDAQVVIL
jgi:hypothetical protein